MAGAVVLIVEAAGVDVDVSLEVGVLAPHDGSNASAVSDAHMPVAKRTLRVRIAALFLGLVVEVDVLAVDAGDGQRVHLVVGAHADRAIDAVAFFTDHVIVACG